MARCIPTTEQFAIGAYLGLVEGYENVVYDSMCLSERQPPAAVVARSEANQSVCFADVADDLRYYPAELSERSLVRRLVERYCELVEVGRALEYDPERIHCQLWLLRPCEPGLPIGMPARPGGKVAYGQFAEESLAKAQARLASLGVELELVGPQEAAERFRKAGEHARRQDYALHNPFIASLLLSEGRLDYDPGEELTPATLFASWMFPVELRSPKDIPRFVRQLLTRREVVHWVGFQSFLFDDLRQWFVEKGVGAELGELYNALETGIEPMMETEEDYLEPDYWRPFFPAATYTAHQVAEITRLILENAETLRRALRGYLPTAPLRVDIRFMLPYLWRAAEWFDPAQIEREILRFGGSRDQVLAHFAQHYPDKRPYRLELLIELHGRHRKRREPRPGWNSMAVRIADPWLSERRRVDVALFHRTDFTGYVVMMLNRMVENMRL